MGAESFPISHDEAASQSTNVETSFSEPTKNPSTFGEKAWNPPEHFHIDAIQNIKTPEQVLSLDRLSQLQKANGY